MSYVHPDIFSSALSDIDLEYGKIAKMTAMRYKIHKYVGMTMTNYSPGRVMFSIVY